MSLTTNREIAGSGNKKSRAKSVAGKAAELRSAPDVASCASHAGRELTRELLAKLLAQGRRQGFLTTEEVADALGSDAIPESRIEEVKTIFGEEGISVVPACEQQADRTRPSSTNRAIDEESSANATGRVYLREMGQVSRLTREG